MPELNHANHLGLGHEEVGTELRLRVLDGMVASSAVADVSGAVSLDLDDGYVFLTRMVGNITSLAFVNVPTGTTEGALWTVMLSVDGSGGYTLSSPPTVTWVDGSSWDTLDLSASAVNIMQFTRVNDTTYGSFVWNGSLALEPYKVCFLGAATVDILTEDENIDVANYSKYGSGTITFEKNGSTITGSGGPVWFDAGDRLSVICAGETSKTAVRIPRYA